MRTLAATLVIGALVLLCVASLMCATPIMAQTDDGDGSSGLPTADSIAAVSGGEAAVSGGDSRDLKRRPKPTPEPTTMVLVGAGAAALLGRTLLKRRAKS